MKLHTKIGRQLESLLTKDDSSYGRLTKIDVMDGRDIIYINFTPTSLCQYRAYDIRNIEPIIITLEKDSRPVVFSNRDDFPVTSHQNPSVDGHRELCLFELSYNELKHLLDGSFLLRQIDDWLCKVASNELHGTTQPIEPYFMPVYDTVVFNNVFDTTFFLRPFEVGGRKYNIQENQQQTNKDFRVLHLPFNLEVETDNIIRPLPQNIQELSECFSDFGFGDKIVETVLAIDPTISGNDQVNKMRILMSLIIKKTLNSDDGSRSEFEYRCILTSKSIGQIRRPLGLNQSSPGLQSLADIDIEHCNWYQNFDRSLAAIYNGIYDHPARKCHILQIGVGAVGSQILDNCIKAGFGNWTLIDKDIFLPHNVARHRLDARFFGNHKTRLLEDLIKRTYADEESVARKISYPIDVLDSEHEIIVSKLIEESDIILDTAASPAVSKFIAIDNDHNKRVVSFFMNPSGTSAIALIEDKERICRLDTIECEYFKRLIDNPEQHRHHFDRTDKVYYSASCRDSSAIISQDLVAMFSALCSKKLKKLTKSESAEVLIWNETGDGITVDTFTPALYTREERKDSEDNTWTIFISSVVMKELENMRLEAGTVETGGVLIGGMDKFRNIIYVVGNIPAPDDSIRTPTSYIRGCKGLPKKIENVERLTHNSLGYIGEWHSHPGANTEKSNDDDKLHESIKEFTSSNCSPAIMIIVGSCGYSLFI